MRTGPCARTPPPAPNSGQKVRSYYRQYAEKCQTAAGKARTEKQRAALQEMVRVWHDFAAEHERMVQENGTDSSWGRIRSIPGWM